MTERARSVSRGALSCVLAVLGASCSSGGHAARQSPGGAPVASGPSGGDASAADGSAPIHVSITVPGVPPSTEGTRCLKVRLGNPEAFKVGTIHNVLSQASHHFVLSAVTDPAQTEAPLFDCPPFRAALVGAPLTITQRHDDTVQLPAGVVYPIAKNQLMHLEVHYINTTSKTVDVHAEAELYPAPESKGVVDASFLLVGDMDIHIPANATHSTGPVYIPLPQEYEGVHFFALTGHTHRFGTDVTVGTAASQSAPPTQVYAPAHFTWDEPELKRFEPTFQVPKQGGFSLQCEWNNPTSHTVGYGESANAEMCFFWAYYYPKRAGQRVLLHGIQNSPYVLGASVPDAPPCVPKGAAGNGEGVGKYCSAIGDQCLSTTGLCLADYSKSSFSDFCTKICVDDSECGSGAVCVRTGSSPKACVPASCAAAFTATDAGAPSDAGAG